MKPVYTEISSTYMDCLSTQVKHCVNLTGILLIFWMVIINIDWKCTWNASAYQKVYLGTEVNCTCSLYYYDRIHIGEELILSRGL